MKNVKEKVGDHIDQLAASACFNADDTLNMIHNFHQFVKGRSWEEIIDFIEERTGEDLTHRRCDKCPECGSSVNFGRRCSNGSCENSKRELDPSECIKLSQEATIFAGVGS